MADDELTKSIRVEETLANVLDMFSDRTTVRSLARYFAEQADEFLPKETYDYTDDPVAVRYLADVAQALTPPDDRRMGFQDRPREAARQAMPYKYGGCLDVLVALGWGNTPFDLPATTAREAGEAAREALRKRTIRLATQMLEKWRREGKVFQI